MRLPRPLWIALATVVLVVVALGLRIGIPAYWEEVGIREVERVGGSVDFEWGGPAWLRRWAEYKQMRVFYRVRAVYVAARPFTNAEMVHLQRFKNLDKADLDSTHVTDAGLKNLSRLSSLSVVDLSNTGVTDAGLRHLSGLKNLKFLDLDGTDVSEEGVADLKRAIPGMKVLLFRVHE